MQLRNTSLALLLGVAALLSACGPAGTISGKVNVEGGSPAGIAVIILGPASAATVTKDDGSFTATGLPDGAYVVRATLRGAEEEEISAASTIAQGKGSEVMLNFKLATSKITGRVSFTDGSTAQGLTVSAFGPVSAGAKTEANGSFTFEGLKSGAYLVSVEAPDTREGRVAIGVFASGTVDAGELKLTPIGSIGGIVSYNSMPAPGVTVSIPGTNLASITDAMGHFSLVGIPAGPQIVQARIGANPFFRSASVMQTIARGANPDLMITITDEMPATGTVAGVVTFHGPRTPRDITVTAPGSGVMANPAANGTFQLQLPEGVWDIVASAPAHPPLTLGRVAITPGRVITLPGRELSWWRPLWTSSNPISAAGPLFTTPADCTHNWSLTSIVDTSGQRLALTNALTFEFRLVAVGTTTLQRISRTGKYASWTVSSSVFVYEIANGNLQVFQSPTNAAVNDVQFSADESVIFIHRAGPTLTRIAFSAPNMPRVFPQMGNATAITMQTPDRWFVQEGPDIRLVVPANDVGAVFTAVSSFSVNTAAWALTNCTATCQLRVLAPTSTTAAQDMSVMPTPGTVFPFGGRADYPCFTQGASAYCVRAMDGTHTPLVAIPNLFRLNEAGDRVVWTFAGGPGTAVREEPFPPQMATANLAASANVWTVGWLSPIRAYAYETSGATRSLHLIRNGTDSPDLDVGTQGVLNRAPMLVVPQASTSKWRAVLGNGAMRNIDIATSIAPIAGAARPLTGGTNSLTAYGSVSFDLGQSWVVDEQAMMMRTVLGGVSAGLGFRSGATEVAGWARGGPSQQAYLVFNNLTYLEGGEDVLPSGTIGPLGTGNFVAALAVAGDQRTLLVGSFGP
ncbi:MAG: carboxypeptidase regulatory-like domain-containing protein [Archangium sp.]